MTKSIPTLLQQAFEIGVQAAQAQYAIAPYIPEQPKGKVVVIGFGKAGAAMAQALEQHWPYPATALSGVVVVPYGSSLPTTHIRIIEASHPVPDANSVLAAETLLHAVNHLDADDLVICLISGGGSSLLCLPIDGLCLKTKQSINQQLLVSGATIGEINCVRRHLSAIKGGRLAAACAPAAVLNLIISDVPGDNPINIASGPTVADPSTCAQALEILDQYQIQVPIEVKNALLDSAWESPKPYSPQLPPITTHLIATPHHSLEKAAQFLQKEGINTLILGDAIEADAKEVAKIMAAIAKSIQQYHQPIAPPAVILSGGETSVRVTGSGVGGRNVEFLLALLTYLRGTKGIHALSADTDGVDGAAPVAGAYFTDQSYRHALKLQLDPKTYLDNNDAHSFFKVLQQQLITGPTHTNVNDFRAVFVE